MMRIGLLSLLALVLGLGGCTKEYPLGSKQNPLKLYFTPSVDAETISTNARDFVNFLEKETGFYVKTAIPASYVAVVEAFGSNRADIAVMNSFGYLMAHKKFGASAKLTIIRYGHKTYGGAFYARANGPVNKLEDIAGKKMAYTDASSTSGYILPYKMLKERNIVPANTVFAVKHDNVITMIYQGQVDAGAAFFSPPAEDGTPRDARMRVKTQFPDVEKKIKIIAYTDQIPNDPFVFRQGLPEEVVQKFIAALNKFLSTEEGRTTFRNIYSFDQVVPATDADYDVLRDAIAKAGVDASDLMK